MQAITINNLSVELGGTPVLRGLSAQLERGRITGLLGPSGAGKTTLMKVLVGLQRPSGGEVQILDHPVGSSQLRGQIGYMTQSQSVYPDLTVRENLQYFAALSGGGQQVDQTIGKVRLDGLDGRLVRDLSGGQKSRVGLAAALLGDPPLLVLDEPTVGLDPLLRQELWHIFRQLADGGITLIVSSHVMDEAEHCDDLMLLREGRLLAFDQPLALMRRTHSDSVEQAFLRLVEPAS